MKRIFAVVIVAVMVLTLVGCSSKTTDIEGTITGYISRTKGGSTPKYIWPWMRGMPI